MAAGHKAEFDETATRVGRVDEDGAPLEFAVKCAIEEVVGVRGDIDEGDAGGRLDDDPDMVAKLDALEAELEALTPEDVGGTALVLDDAGRAVLDALLAAGEEWSFTDLMEGELPAAVQDHLAGGATTIDRLREIASGKGYDDFVAALDGAVPTPA